MRRLPHLVLTVVLLALAPVLAGCESFEDFDMDKLDFLGLNKKKPLPGERRDLFPGGVPGVTQGIPPEFQKSYVEKQQQAEAAAAAEQQKEEAAKAAEEAQKKAAAAAEAEKPKPKPKRKVVRAPSRPPTQVTVQPARQPAQQAPWPDANQQQQQSSQAPWPAQGQAPQAQQPQAQQQEPVWNTAPPPGTFSR
jgi:hypothetical protein